MSGTDRDPLAEARGCVNGGLAGCLTWILLALAAGVAWRLAHG